MSSETPNTAEEQMAEKPVGYLEKPVSFWQRLPVRSDSGGVSPMFLEGRERFMNERMRGMTPERRAWRKQWLQDQVLSSREPVEVPQLYRELNNPFRRVYQYPFLKIEKYVNRKSGQPIAGYLAKNFALAIFWFVPAVYVATYAAMFWSHDWTFFNNGLRAQWSKPVVLPNDPSYPFTSSKENDDYASYGFKKSIFYKTAEEIIAEESKSP